MVEDTRVFKLAPTTAIQQLGDGEGAVILELDSGQLHTCNDTTAAFMAQVDGTRTFAAVVEALETQFNVDREQLRADLAELAEQLHGKGLIL
jgi:pyrroloquinoline quinone biosynthesis protein D